jgi:DNA-binding transcriptional regulator/RsmH inhibitor MraZ
LLELAGINKNVVLIGRNDKVEIWDEKKFNAHDESTEKNWESLAEKINELN